MLLDWWLLLRWLLLLGWTSSPAVVSVVRLLISLHWRTDFIRQPQPYTRFIHRMRCHATISARCGRLTLAMYMHALIQRPIGGAVLYSYITLSNILQDQILLLHAFCINCLSQVLLTCFCREEWKIHLAFSGNASGQLQFCQFRTCKQDSK